MKTGRVSLIAMSLTLMFALASVTAAQAELFFADMQGSWWKTTKQMDKGYLFGPLTDDGSKSKAVKFNYKQKPGYMYIRLNSFAAESYTELLLLNKDNATGDWIIISIQSGSAWWHT